jgi:2-oxoglutarate ferredoxin oxidoreductase subunit alpha
VLNGHAQSCRAVAVTGSGGSGAVTAGLILLDAVAHAGLYALLSRSSGPQIRGGESAAMLRFGPRPVHCPPDRFDLLVALDWRDFGRFSDELPLDADSLVLADPDAGVAPAAVAACGAGVLQHAFRASARRRSGGRANMVAVGACGARLGLPLRALLSGAERTLADKDASVVEVSRECITDGYREVAGALGGVVEPAEDGAEGRPTRWNISGNEAAGLGALRAGIRFVAAYPITPASEMLEWLAPRLEQVGGALLQAEDELASINMVIGSSFGGVPALTATSGPGLSLMVEGIGLAVATETPVIVVDVMRGGPSTGIPTKTEQADLDIALYGLHGDAPHLVLAALDVADCAFTVDWATRLAERLQTAAVVLSDQLLGQSRAIVDPPAGARGVAPRRAVGDCDGAYRRYARTADGVSPMARPGTVGCTYTADGLEHNDRGIPSSVAADHRAQLDKRRQKIDGADYGPGWAEIDGIGDLCLLTWGSCRGAVVEAAQRLRRRGRSIRVVALRLLAPLCREALRAAIGEAGVLVIEQNHGGQLFRYLHAEQTLPDHALSLARPGPLPLRPGEIVAAVERSFAIDSDGRDRR